MTEREKIEIVSIQRLLLMNLSIPDYQRPYKWTIRNVEELLDDITHAIEEGKRYASGFKYRLGTVLLYKTENGVLEIVDGQQRLLTLVLINLCVNEEFDCSLLSKEYSDKVTQNCIHTNYMYIREWFSLKEQGIRKDFADAMKNILEAVIIYVDKVSEAFQLFDSQNTRGKALDPHDLLKAYHLREMKEYPYEMEHAVTKWEAKDTKAIRELFELYLFPIWNWSRGFKTHPFTDKEIDTYKGIPEASAYTYARRASKAMPYFQIAEPFIAGNDFFEMVDHYMRLLNDVKREIITNPDFKIIESILFDPNGKRSSRCENKEDSIDRQATGFKYAENLFYCALLSYYDKFHNFNALAVKKLFLWAFMIRVDMENLSYESINNYATGRDQSRYSNGIAMFSRISLARVHNDISNIPITVRRNPDAPTSEKWKTLYIMLKQMSGLEG